MWTEGPTKQRERKGSQRSHAELGGRASVKPSRAPRSLNGCRRYPSVAKSPGHNPQAQHNTGGWRCVTLAKGRVANSRTAARARGTARPGCAALRSIDVRTPPLPRVRVIPTPSPNILCMRAPRGGKS
ncbi:unnamed protein product, partial [Iphiclides podalirius]